MDEPSAFGFNSDRCAAFFDLPAWRRMQNRFTSSIPMPITMLVINLCATRQGTFVEIDGAWFGKTFQGLVLRLQSCMWLCQRCGRV